MSGKRGREREGAQLDASKRGAQKPRATHSGLGRQLRAYRNYNGTGWPQENLHCTAQYNVLVCVSARCKCARTVQIGAEAAALLCVCADREHRTAFVADNGSALLPAEMHRRRGDTTCVWNVHADHGRQLIPYRKRKHARTIAASKFTIRLCKYATRGLNATK